MQLSKIVRRIGLKSTYINVELVISIKKYVLRFFSGKYLQIVGGDFAHMGGAF